MDKMKIATRLTLAFAAMVLLLIALGAISLLRSAHQSEELHDVVDTRIPITKSLGVLADSVNTQAIQFRNLVLFSSEPIAKSAVDQITAARANTGEHGRSIQAAGYADFLAQGRGNTVAHAQGPG